MSSLGDLLAAEGFKKPKRRPPRSSLPPRSDSMPVPSNPRDKNRKLCSDDRRRSFPNDLPRPRGSSKEVSIASSTDDEEVFDGFDCYKPTARRCYNNELFDSSPIETVVSVLTGYVTRFIDDERFRTSTYHRCTSCLLPAESRDEDSRPIGTLKRAIGTVERAVDGCASAQELKKASMQLSVITSLSSAELRSGYTSGVPNTNLAACAHLYLAVVYKLNGKDAASAKHLLQVFADCPNRARTVLLPELWDRIFLSHVSHIMEWYFKQEKSTGRTALEEVYNSNLDIGTKRFALYYKEWLVDGGDAPRLPSVPVPDDSFSDSSEEIPRPCTSSSYKATVSRELYESVFSRPTKIEKSGENKIENIEKHVLRSSSDDDVEWANECRSSSHEFKDHVANKSESKHGSRQSLPTFPSRARTNDRYKEWSRR